MSSNIQPHAPALDDQIRESHLSFNPAMALANLTHGEALTWLDCASHQARQGKSDCLDREREEDESVLRQVMAYAHYLQYEAPRFMDAWTRFARRVAEAELILAQQEERDGKVLAMALDKIKANEPDSQGFNMAAALVMGQESSAGQRARDLFERSDSGAEFKEGLVELLEETTA